MNLQDIIFSRAFKRLLMSLLALFLLFLLCDKIIMPLYVHYGQEVVLPKIIGMSFEQAREFLQARGFKIIKNREMHDPHLPEGYIISQNPEPYAVVKKGRRVYVTVSMGKREVIVPRLIGGSEKDAEFTLKRLELELGEVNYDFSNYYPKGVVIGQLIPPDSSVKVGTRVDIIVSLGKPYDKYIVPKVVGMNLKEARRSLMIAGLKPGKISYRVQNELLPETVIEQSIPPGTQVHQGDSVDLVVSKVEINDDKDSPIDSLR